MFIPLLSMVAPVLAFHHVLKHMQAVEEMKKRGLIGTPDSTLFSPWAVNGRNALLRHWNQRPLHPEPDKLFRMSPHPVADLHGLPSLCRRCSAEIDREKVEAELAKHDTLGVAKRAAKNAVFCSLHCAIKPRAVKGRDGNHKLGGL